MKEKQKHKDAFEYFLSLGADPTEKNISKTAEQHQVHPRTIWVWYSEFNWRNRADQRLLQIRKQTEELADKNIAEANADILKDIDQYMMIIKQSFGNALEENEEGEMIISVTPKTAHDINSLITSWDKLANRRSILMGEPGSKEEHKILVEIVDGSS